MGIAGMNNRIKTNLSLKNKSNKYRKAYFNKELNLTGNFKLKTPTEDDLLKTKKSNRTFLENEKKKNRILLAISFLLIISIVFYFWLF